MAYTETALVKEYLEISSNELNALIERCVDATTDVINSYCRQSFESHGQGNNSTLATRYFHAINDVCEDRTVLRLDKPLALITSVTNGDGTSITSGQYVTQPYTDTPYHCIVLTDGTTWTYTTTPWGAIQVRGHWSYSINTPEEIALAATELAAFYFQKRQSNMESDRAIVSDDGLLMLPDGIPRHIRTKLEPFKRRMI